MLHQGGRGGSWMLPLHRIRSAFREVILSYCIKRDVGFRVGRDAVMKRVFRGGSYQAGIFPSVSSARILVYDDHVMTGSALRSPFRCGSFPGMYSDGNGFRLACNPSSKLQAVSEV